MPDAWATNTMKAAIRVWLTARDRAITAGHELVEMVEDLVEEVRHEREMEAQARSAPPAPVAARPEAAPAPPRRRTKAASSDVVGTVSPRPSRTRRSTAKSQGAAAAEDGTATAERPAKATRRPSGASARKRRPAGRDSAGEDSSDIVATEAPSSDALPGPAPALSTPAPVASAPAPDPAADSHGAAPEPAPSERGSDPA